MLFKKINFKLYFLLTACNLLISYFLLEEPYHFILVVLFLAFLVNQFLLFYVVQNLIGPNEDRYKRTMAFLGKFLSLGLVFVYIVINYPNKILLFLIIYIFQLIILIISNKRITKSN